MSHEIRTPMTAIIGMSDLLWESPLTGEQKRFVEAIRSSGENLLQVINDILDLSKVEAGQIEIEKVPFNLIKLVNNICEAQTFQARLKEIELIKWIKPEVETLLVGDSVRLGQILTNLIGNAIKFTEKGEVFVEVKRQDVSERTIAEGTGSDEQLETTITTELLFSVTDTGIGIPEEKWEAIFDRFTQADSSTTRQFGGTGLGLSISHQLTELMGGRMWVESKAGQGSTFFFTAKFEVTAYLLIVKQAEAVDNCRWTTCHLHYLVRIQLQVILMPDSKNHSIGKPEGFFQVFMNSNFAKIFLVSKEPCYGVPNSGIGVLFFKLPPVADVWIMGSYICTHFRQFQGNDF